MGCDSSLIITWQCQGCSEAPWCSCAFCSICVELESIQSGLQVVICSEPRDFELRHAIFWMLFFSTVCRLGMTVCSVYTCFRSLEHSGSIAGAWLYELLLLKHRT